jgi:hypothetical protein
MGQLVPGATVRLTHLETGQAWVSWTDDEGKFAFAGLPAGKYRIEAQQLGFEPSQVEQEFAAATSDAPEKLVELRVRPLRSAPPVVEKSAESKPAENPAAPPTEDKSENTTAAPKDSAPQPGAGAPAGRGAANRPAGSPQQGQGAGRRQMTPEQMRQMAGGFLQVDPTGQPGTPPDPTGDLGAAPDMGPLGDASSSDAFLIRGSVGRGVTAGNDSGLAGLAGLAGMFGFGGFGQFGPGADGGGGFPGAGEGGTPGGMGGLITMIGGGPGGRPQPGGQAQGQGRGQQGRNQQGQARGQQGQQNQQGRGGQGQQNPQAGGGPGGGFGQGMEALWGMQRLVQAQANRMRISFFNRYGNSVLDARPYSLTEPDPAKIDSYRETFGVNFGGPLRLGKLYDGREKTFWFLNYQLGRNRNPVDTFATVPLPQERMGDFTARGVQLFDPNSNLTGPRTPLGSVIPAAMLDPAAVGLLEFIPLPNLPGTVQNFHLQTRVPQSTDSFNIRLMHTLTPKLNFQGTYGLSSNRSDNFQSFPELQRRQSTLGQNLMLGLTQNLAQRLLNDTRIFWNRNRVDTLNQFAFGRDIAGALGITGISTDAVNFGVPRVDLTNFTDANDPVPSLRRNQTFRVMDTLTYTRSKHTWRAGIEVRRAQNNTRNDPIARGQFTFTGLMTSQLDAQGRPLPGTGFDFADFLLGLPQSTTVRFGSSNVYFRNWAFIAYMQDDWRIHPRFSVNWGLRYENVTPPVELFDKLANLDVNSDITAVAMVLPGEIAPFSGRLPRALVRGDNNNWSPRFGFAWRPKLKRNTVVRGGYSVFYNTWIYNQLSASMANQPPHAQAQTRLTSSARVLTLQNGFPAEPPGTVPNTIAVDPNYRVGHAQIWNTSIETQIVRSLTLDVTYTGTKGTHLDLLRSPNRALPVSPLSTELQRRIPNAPGFTYDTSGASSIYHAMQVRLQKRMARGWMLMGVYTFGKSIDNASTIGGGAQLLVQDDNNFDAERGLSSFDIRHQFRGGWAWELPFGERKRWANKGWQAALLSNWTMNGNATINTGTPFTARILGNAANNSGTGNNLSERADQVGDPQLSRDQRTPLHYFNTAAFVLPAPGTFGNAARNTIPGPGTVQFNMSAGRFIRLGKDGQRRLDLRWEAQNIFNTPNFTGLNTVVNSSTFGRVQGARQMRRMDVQIRVNF